MGNGRCCGDLNDSRDGETGRGRDSIQFEHRIANPITHASARHLEKTARNARGKSRDAGAVVADPVARLTTWRQIGKLPCARGSSLRVTMRTRSATGPNLKYGKPWPIPTI
ncbi:hypothetical protein FRACA_4970001 [Frankia canadensis]|uniref:Uncharacterized protein n=1 Tax=Frankia canadensis TaxID=1836972 RepID=A0A2I2KY62_9ACTN|nr:hypothetical protein FRACA_4970001 [Frankia canadensis]SOU57902.1 hypothetical protein FRACA_4970001 [Frankia canadensis]